MGEKIHTYLLGLLQGGNWTQMEEWGNICKIKILWKNDGFMKHRAKVCNKWFISSLNATHTNTDSFFIKDLDWEEHTHITNENNFAKVHLQKKVYECDKMSVTSFHFDISIINKIKGKKFVYNSMNLQFLIEIQRIKFEK